MNAKILVPALLLALCPIAPSCPAAEAPPSPTRPAIYDEKADGARQIATALKTAQKEGRRVLLVFGANWCGWCHKLHKLFATDAPSPPRYGPISSW
jgi:thioredoxin-related protein